MITRAKTQQEIKIMHEAGRMHCAILDLLEKQVTEGISTKDLADIASKELKTFGAKPAFLGYYGFPDVLCTSVNDEVVHGIPRPDKILRSGDIISFDFGVLHRGLITDAARSVIVGSALDKKDQQLVSATKQSLEAGIDVVKDGVKTGTIGAAIQSILEKAGFGIVREFVGHGVGHQLHEEPNIPNYGLKHTGTMLGKNMTIAIEPMATKKSEAVYIDSDGWTVKTSDGSRSAHFEETILITETGAEIITRK